MMGVWVDKDQIALLSWALDAESKEDSVILTFFS